MTEYGIDPFEARRLHAIGDKYKPQLRVDFTRSRINKKIAIEQIRAILSIVMFDIMDTTSAKYRLTHTNFDPFIVLLDNIIDDLIAEFTPVQVINMMKVVSLPPSVSRVQAQRAVFGLDYTSADLIVRDFHTYKSVGPVVKKAEGLAQIRLNNLANRTIDTVIQETRKLLFEEAKSHA